MLLSQKIAQRRPESLPRVPGPGARRCACSGGRLYSSLQDFDVFRLQSLWTLRDFELYRLPFLKAAEAVRLDGREMHENIFAILPRYEAKPFGIVKPLHCSLFHCMYLFLFLEIRLEDSAGLKSGHTDRLC